MVCGKRSGKDRSNVLPLRTQSGTVRICPCGHQPVEYNQAPISPPVWHCNWELSASHLPACLLTLLLPAAAAALYPFNVLLILYPLGMFLPRIEYRFFPARRQLQKQTQTCNNWQLKMTQLPQSGVTTQTRKQGGSLIKYSFTWIRPVHMGLIKYIHSEYKDVCCWIYLSTFPITALEALASTAFVCMGLRRRRLDGLLKEKRACLVT